jgi:hypothetical protein
MARASKPHTPEAELAIRRAHGGPGGALTPELKAFCQSGVSVIVAACGPGGVPVAGLGYGCSFLADGRMRVLLARSANTGLLGAMGSNGGIAATFTQPSTHRSIQVKGSGATIAAPSGQDRQEAVRQMEGLRRELVGAEYAAPFAAAYCHVDEEDIAAIDFTAEAAFAQTPGPGAGAELKP